MGNFLFLIVGLVLVAGAVAAAVVIFAVVMQKGRAGRTPAAETGAGRLDAGADGPMPYVARGGLLTEAELRFLAALEPAVGRVFGAGARICPQVTGCKAANGKSANGKFAEQQIGEESWGAVLGVKPGLERGEAQKWRNRVDRKTFDFVITDERARVLACVELDDSSHGKATRRERDAFLERACEAAGVRLVRVDGKGRYEVEGLVGELAKPSIVDG